MAEALTVVAVVSWFTVWEYICDPLLVLVVKFVSAGTYCPRA